MKIFLFLLLIVAVGCTTTPNVEQLNKLNSGAGWKSEVKPRQLKSYITWEKAIDLIVSNKVKSVAQGHDLVVRIFLKNGDMLSTIEPDIDTIFLVIKHCGRRCSNIRYITQ